ncbi:cysteine hydrolase family protein [Streptomyces sp. NPDC057287]|uniref:cysteine hydrolase family protein n=1 Tax=Streptomyces sp. NPDC057287 TaxID=3346086 RepID=UPI003639F1FE
MTLHATPLHALIVVDVQQAFVRGGGALPEAARLVDRTAGLIARARAAGALVVHVQNDGPAGADDEPHTAGWELHHSVEAGPAEVAIRKTHDDAFQETPLESLLTASGVRSLAVCGLMSEMCVQATARTAVARGYRVVMPHDAHATYDIPAEPGISPAVPAATVSRVAAWPLSRDADVTARSADVTFTAPRPSGS